jgi:tol-pal system protein YbgF
MIRQMRIAPGAIAPALLLTLTIALAAGCADTSGGGGGGGGQSNEDFEIRGMIAADRQQMQAMDERLRRLESQIQDLAHSAPPEPVAPEGNAAPARPQAAPSAGAPPAPEAAPEPPLVPPGTMTPDVENPGGEAAPPPGAEAPAPGAPPAPAAGASETPERSTISPAPPSDTGANPPAAEEGAAEGGAGEGGAAEGGNPPAADSGGASDDEGANAGAAADNGNPPAPGAAAANGDASANNGGASAGNEGAPPNEGEEGAPASSGGEEVASAPPAAATENAPAALPPARWPEDLSSELQSPANFKGGAGRLFQSGLNDMQSHNYSAAVETFATLQKKYPRSDLGEQASYFSGSAFNEMGKYDQAILQYNDVVMRFPKGKYASEALLRESQAFIQINDKVDARLTLQKLINEHAGTPQAAQAGAMMKTLESD